MEDQQSPKDAFEVAATKILSNDSSEIYTAMAYLRRLFSSEDDPPIQKAIDLQLVPRFVELLWSDKPELQFEALRILSNILSGTDEQGLHVVEYGAVPKILELINSPTPGVQDQAIWAIGNIAAINTSTRDYVLGRGGLATVAGVVRTPVEPLQVAAIRTISWTISNLCRGVPLPEFALIEPVIPIINQLLYHDDIEVATDACYAISHLSKGSNQYIQAILKEEILRQVIKFLTPASDPRGSINLTPALEVIRNIVDKEDSAPTEFLLNVPVQIPLLPSLLSLLNNRKSLVKKEAFACIVAIMSHVSDVTLTAAVEARAFQRLFEYMMTTGVGSKQAVVSIVSAVLNKGTSEQICSMIDQNAVSVMNELTKESDARLAQSAAHALEQLIIIANESNKFTDLLSKYHEMNINI